MSDKLTQEFSKLTTSEEKVVEETKNTQTNALPSDAIDLLFQASQRVSIEQALADQSSQAGIADFMDVDAIDSPPSQNVPKKHGKIPLFSFVDAGGHNNYTSISTILWIGQRALLIGSASANLPNLSKCLLFLRAYVSRLHSMYPKAIHVLISERNSGIYSRAVTVHESMRRMRWNVIEFCERSHSAGVFTNAQQACNALSGFLARIKSDLGVAQEADFVTVAEKDGHVMESSSPSDYENVVDELKKQLTRMRCVGTRNEIPVFSGKGARGSGLRDDGYLTWSGAILWSRLYMERMVLMRGLGVLEFLQGPKKL